jgi:DMSO reductase anchor subunit
VDHDPKQCIGCQYCTWACAYGVPQFDTDRGVVGKCDMCHSRLDLGLAPACVNACPEQAIRIEIVDVAEWRREHEEANAPGLPSAEYSLATTRFTLPADLVGEPVPVRKPRPHVPWSLVLLLVLSQLAVGAMLASGVAGVSPWPALAAAIAAMACAPAHLGRPAHAWRAFRNWRTSWLSREIIFFTGFLSAAGLFCIWRSPVVLWTTAAMGVAGVVSSARIYMLPSRPVWNTRFTLVDFLLTAAVLGPLVTMAISGEREPWVAGLTLFAAICQLALGAYRRLVIPTALRLAALALLAISPAATLVLALGAALVTRHLFFARAEEAA